MRILDIPCEDGQDGQKVGGAHNCVVYRDGGGFRIETYSPTMIAVFQPGGDGVRQGVSVCYDESEDLPRERR